MKGIRAASTNEDALEDHNKTKKCLSRKGKGCHVLTQFKKLIADKGKWFPIIDSDDYNFPGVFKQSYPQRLGYCEDITKLPNYEPSDPHFMFSDIQLGKGKARPKRLLQMDVDGKEESMVYRFVPCGGVKKCGTEGCSYVAPTSAVKPCSQHKDTPLVRTGECPVIFFYVWPEDIQDNRRWLTGMLHSGDLTADNLHNHPLHSESRIPVKVDSDIRRAIVENPHIKTSELVVGELLVVAKFVLHNIFLCVCMCNVGKGMQYMPGSASLSATHRSKVKNIRLSTLRDSHSNADPRSAILDFERDALAYNRSMKHKVEGMLAFLSFKMVCLIISIHVHVHS